MDESLKLPKSPRRVGIEYALVIAVIGIVVAVALLPHGGPGHRVEPFDQGVKVGA